MTVFANALEISAEAQGCKIIAAFPDVCFTPPQTPATPPGVPIPYPNFGLDSDLSSGSSTVKISGKPISIENASNYKKISGDEAGCAPKKGVITSKNMGKAYAKMWSMDVKVEGKGVVRFGDIMTSNHASDTGDTPPMPTVATAAPSAIECEAILNKLGMQVHEHGKKPTPCNTDTDESEHYFENQMIQTKREDGINYKPWKDYSTGGAPCVCMQSWHNKAHSTPVGKDGPKRGTPHNNKTRIMREFLKDHKEAGTTPTLGQAMDKTKEAYKEHDPRIANVKPEEKQKEALDCLETIYLTYLASVAEPVKNPDGTERPMTNAEMRATPLHGAHY